LAIEKARMFGTHHARSNDTHADAHLFAPVGFPRLNAFRTPSISSQWPFADDVWIGQQAASLHQFHWGIRSGHYSRGRAPYRLVEINDRARHESGIIRNKEVHRAGRFLRIDEPAERKSARRFFHPVRVATLGGLKLPFVVRSHPADVELIDTDTVAHHRESSVRR